jgi:RNA polymerase sigma-70 factor, ECF subfamily
VATVTRLVGDLDIAEDAVQDACALAVERWPSDGTPANPRAWLIGVARHKAIDRIRREARRPAKEVPAAARSAGPEAATGEAGPMGDDELALIFTCCHPALDREVRMALTLRAAGGLSTAEIAAAFLVPVPTMAKRLVRAKHKIRQAGISFRVPGQDELPARLADVLRVLYLIFTAGHHATSGPDLVNGELCDTAIRLARNLAALLPGEPEPAGLLALLLLTDARRAPAPARPGNWSCSRTRIDGGGIRRSSPRVIARPRRWRPTGPPWSWNPPRPSGPSSAPGCAPWLGQRIN